MDLQAWLLQKEPAECWRRPAEILPNKLIETKRLSY